MKKACVFLADGFEEMEAVGTIDILKRAEIETLTISISNFLEVKGAHGINLICDFKFDEVDFSSFDIIIFPGGMEGVNRMKDFTPIRDLINEFHNGGKYIAAICAAPIILYEAGILNGNNFTCYEGIQKFIKNGIYSKQKVVQDKNIITSDCVGSVFDFGFRLVSILKGYDEYIGVRNKMILL